MTAGPMSQATSPLTRTADVTLLKTIEVAHLVDRWRRELDIDVAPEIGHHEQIRLYRCNATGLEFFWPADVAGSGHLYELFQKFPW